MTKYFLLVLLFCQMRIPAQDTFSILAYDSITGEVGGAGASCVNLFQLGFPNDFIIELFPDTGAIACQASYMPANQTMARNRMRAGDAPQNILNYMQSNDAGANPAIRQYGVLRRMNGTVYSAAYTGSACTNYKNHIVGPNYTIQGNILLGQHVLDSMEVRFNREQGSLACKLMAAMQGAKMVGADTRCAGNNSSSLFAFLKVALPTDSFGKPYFLISLKTQKGDSIEPIDSLQKLFNNQLLCEVNTTGFSEFRSGGSFNMFPNPADGQVRLVGPKAGVLPCRITDISGRTLWAGEVKDEVVLDVSGWGRGVYLVETGSGSHKTRKKLILSD